MLACKHCSTHNSLDSTFCKKCGTAVPADQKREATIQLDKLVDEGLAALGAGRTSEALAIADSAVATDPTHLGALHLKSAVHERRGEIADALESAERIVELNPDSELDRIKRNGLRTSLLNASTPVRSDKRIAFLAAGAATVLVACIGVLLARRAPAAPVPVASNAPVVEASIAAPIQTAASVPTSAPASNTVAPTDSTTANVRASDNLPTRDPGTSGGTLPGLDGETGGTIGLAPVVPPNPAAQPAPKTVAKRGPDPDPGTIKTPSAPEDDPGQIEISVSRGPRRSGGSTPVPETRTNGAAAYARVGTERFELGDYAGAAANLEKAVSGGGDAVDLNRRLAQAYGRLGRNSDAAAAYERSRAAANAALASGRGDRERLQAARDAADAGLKTVKGG